MRACSEVLVGCEGHGGGKDKAAEESEEGMGMWDVSNTGYLCCHRFGFKLKLVDISLAICAVYTFLTRLVLLL